MDFAYDHITERSYSGDRSNTATPKPGEADSSSTPTNSSQAQSPQRQGLQTEFQETFKAFSNSPWGAKLGGWFTSAKTQAASTYEVARKEAERREAEAAKAFEDARRVVVERTKVVVEAAEEQLDNLVNEEKKGELEAQRRQQQEADASQNDAGVSKDAQAVESEDTETFLERFKSEAAKRLKEVQKAEDAADEALLRFGTNIRNFLKDTISITAPVPSADSRAPEVLFESRDATTGKRVIHASRFDAQLHVIHTTSSSFTQDPDAEGSEWEKFKGGFDIATQTDRIADDLERYPELRRAMETLVPEKVEYKDFWTRYYFLKHVVEVREEKRKELLQASAADEEEVGWDEDSDSESNDKGESSGAPSKTLQSASSQAQSSFHARTDSDAITLRPARRSHDEKSVADSEASYDLVSGAASHATSSPKEKPIKEEESDDDWE